MFAIFVILLIGGGVYAIWHALYYVPKQKRLMNELRKTTFFSNWKSALKVWEERLKEDHYWKDGDEYYIESEIIAPALKESAVGLYDERDRIQNFDEWYKNYPNDKEVKNLLQRREDSLLKGITVGENLRRKYCKKKNLVYVAYDRNKLEIPIPEAPFI